MILKQEKQEKVVKCKGCGDLIFNAKIGRKLSCLIPTEDGKVKGKCKSCKSIIDLPLLIDWSIL